MIGGIYRYHSFGLSQFADPKLIQSIIDRAYRVFGESAITKMAYELLPFVGETIFQSANSAFTHWINNKKARGYRHDTTDLIRSMGVAVFYKGEGTAARFIPFRFTGNALTKVQGDTATARISGKYASSEHQYPETRTYTSADGKTHTKTDYALRRRHTENPANRFEEAVSDYNTHISRGWEVVFMATMPYARRLEKDYGKSVMIGAMNWIDNEFRRRLGVMPQKSGWEYEFEL